MFLGIIQLFTGNRVYKDALFAYYPSTNPESYFDSLEKISELPVEKVFRGIIVWYSAGDFKQIEKCVQADAGRW